MEKKERRLLFSVTIKECARRLGQLASIEAEVDKQMQEMNLKIEYVKPR